MQAIRVLSSIPGSTHWMRLQAGLVNDSCPPPQSWQSKTSPEMSNVLWGQKVENYSTLSRLKSSAVILKMRREGTEESSVLKWKNVNINRIWQGV